jgi:hypothetical protein
MNDNGNTLQTLKGIFKEVYNDKPTDAIKSTVAKGRRFKRIGRMMKQRDKEMGIKELGK